MNRRHILALLVCVPHIVFAHADVVPLRFGTYAAALQMDLDTLRRDAIRRARTQPDEASGQKAPITPDFRRFSRP